MTVVDLNQGAVAGGPARNVQRLAKARDDERAAVLAGIKAPLLAGTAVVARGPHGRAVAVSHGFERVSVHHVSQGIQAAAGRLDFPCLVVGSPRGELHHPGLVVPVQVEHLAGFRIGDLVPARAIKPALRACRIGKAQRTARLRPPQRPIALLCELRPGTCDYLTCFLPDSFPTASGSSNPPGASALFEVHRNRSSRKSKTGYIPPQAHSLQDPNPNGNHNDDVQNRVDARGHRDKTVDQPQPYADHDQDQDNIDSRACWCSSLLQARQQSFGPIVQPRRDLALGKPGETRRNALLAGLRQPDRGWDKSKRRAREGFRSQH